MRASSASTWALLICVALATGCCAVRANAGTPAPESSARLPDNALERRPPPARTYADACGPCHDRGGFGARVLADRLGPKNALIAVHTTLAAPAIRLIVRQGLGAMPAISKVEVSDAELEGIVHYLTREAPVSARP